MPFDPVGAMQRQMNDEDKQREDKKKALYKQLQDKQKLDESRDYTAGPAWELKKKELQWGADQKRKEMTPDEVKDVTGLKQGYDILNEIKNKKPGYDTGPFESAKNWFQSQIGVDDPDYSAFMAWTGNQLVEYMRSISGARITDQERQFLKKNQPNISDNDDVFMSKLKSSADFVKSKLKSNIDSYQMLGRDTQGFKDTPNKMQMFEKVNLDKPYQPGQIIRDNVGKTYKVGPDGMSAQEVPYANTDNAAQD